jgi:hypothetical protein
MLSDGHTLWNQLLLTWLTLLNKLMHQEYALGVFLDIVEAFDNLNPDAVIWALEAWQVCPTLLIWYKHYLTRRSI